MLYETMYYPDDDMVKDIFNILLENDIITEKDLIKILEKYNNYIVGFEDTNEKAKEDARAHHHYCGHAGRIEVHPAYRHPAAGGLSDCLSGDRVRHFEESRKGHPQRPGL